MDSLLDWYWLKILLQQIFSKKDLALKDSTTNNPQ